MQKAKLRQFVASHDKLFRFLSRMRNRLHPKNKLRAKGCRLCMGLSVLNGLKIINHGTDNEVVIGDYVRIKNSIIIFNGSHNRVTIGDFSSLNLAELLTEDAQNRISIGTRSHLCGRGQLAAMEGTSISIGDDCLFSGEVHFRTGDSHSILDLNGNRINPSKDIVIDDHVWIGTKVTCLKGVHVSRDTIVAATATLCSEYDQPNVVLGGVPARVIKQGVTWDIARIPMQKTENP